jgi:hypothetical protein
VGGGGGACLLARQRRASSQEQAHARVRVQVHVRVAAKGLLQRRASGGPQLQAEQQAGPVLAGVGGVHGPPVRKRYLAWHGSEEGGPARPPRAQLSASVGPQPVRLPSQHCLVYVQVVPGRAEWRWQEPPAGRRAGGLVKVPDGPERLQRLRQVSVILRLRVAARQTPFDELLTAQNNRAVG